MTESSNVFVWNLIQTILKPNTLGIYPNGVIFHSPGSQQRTLGKRKPLGIYPNGVVQCAVPTMSQSLAWIDSTLRVICGVEANLYNPVGVSPSNMIICSRSGS